MLASPLIALTSTGYMIINHMIHSLTRPAAAREHPPWSLGAAASDAAAGAAVADHGGGRLQGRGEGTLAGLGRAGKRRMAVFLCQDCDTGPFSRGF